MTTTATWFPSSGEVLMIAGDIGGTNSRFALYSKTSTDISKQKCLFRESYKNAGADSFIGLLQKFVSAADAALPDSSVRSNVASCCLAVAGPVVDNVATLTNISFIINGSEISSALNIKHVSVINDFVAVGYGILTLSPNETIEIQKGEARKGCPIFCIGAGTGLGECYLTPISNSSCFEAWPSEGGHSEFAPADAEQIELLSFLQTKFGGRISIERVVSGKGLVNVYEWLTTKNPERVCEVKHPKIMSNNEGAKLISEFAYDYPLCGEAIALMLSAYGSEVGNGGLKWLPFGGIYIAGGIAPLHAERIRDPLKSDFIKSMKNKGRLSGVLDNIPVFIVESTDLGLRGAHYAAYQNLLLPAKEKEVAQEEKEPEAVSAPVAPLAKEKWGWVEDAVYAVGIISVGLFSLIGVNALYQGYKPK